MTKITISSTNMIPPITPPMTRLDATELEVPTVEGYNTITCIYIQTYTSGTYCCCWGWCSTCGKHSTCSHTSPLPSPLPIHDDSTYSEMPYMLEAATMKIYVTLASLLLITADTSCLFGRGEWIAGWHHVHWRGGVRNKNVPVVPAPDAAVLNAMVTVLLGVGNHGLIGLNRNS